MKEFLLKPHRWTIVYSLLLAGSFIFVLLDTFVIPKVITAVVPITPTTAVNTTASQAQVPTVTPTETAISSSSSSTPVVTQTSYQDENIKITIETLYEYNSTLYVADIQLKDASYLKTALANNTYGRNIKQNTSKMADVNNAIFAINGDYYGFRTSGYVLRNGVVYRSNARTTRDDAPLVIDIEGNFSIIHESEISLESLNVDNIWQIFSFGPALVENGQIVVSSSTEVSQSMRSNPRTAIGQVSELHYIFIVSDGRTSESAGISLLELAQEFAVRGCITAYNLDGGGSSTMYFNGEVFNNPTDGRTAGEREVSDIVYIGY